MSNQLYKLNRVLLDYQKPKTGIPLYQGLWLYNGKLSKENELLLCTYKSRVQEILTLFQL